MFLLCENWSDLWFILLTMKMQLQIVSGSMSKINLDTIKSLAENFKTHSREHISWFAEKCSDLELSKTLFLLVLLKDLANERSCFPLSFFQFTASAFLIFLKYSVAWFRNNIWEINWMIYWCWIWTFLFCLGVEFLEVFEAEFHILKSEWELLVTTGDLVFEEVKWIHDLNVSSCYGR